MPSRPRLPSLLPAPVHAEPRPGSLRLSARTPVWLPPAPNDAAWHAGRRLEAGVRAQCGLQLALESAQEPQDEGIALCIDPAVAPNLPPERAAQAYRLEVSRDRARVTGASPHGLRHGVETLLQLVDTRGRVPACRIDDWPSLARRGLLLDISRGKVPTRTELFRLVERCAQWKLDCLLLYTEHTFQFRRHPEIGQGAAPLDAETLRALDRHAAAHHVELMPCLQSLGHMEHVLKLTRYAPLAESELRWSLCPTDEGSYALLRDLYAEYLPNFRSEHLHANCDEPWDLGRGRSRARAEAHGTAQLYLEHLERVQALAAAHGKRTLVWGDVLRNHPELLPRLDPGIVVFDWWYEAEGPFERVADLAARGLEFWVCPGTSSWNALFPRVGNSLANVSAWAEAGRKHGARGLVITDWGDFGHYNLFGNSHLPIAWAAQHAWSGERPAREFDRAFSRVLFGDARGRVAKAVRALGAAHDPGCSIANGSALSFLFFESLEAGTFGRRCRPAALTRAERQLQRVRGQIEDLAQHMGGDEGPQSHAELTFACEASLLAVRKGALTLRYHTWLEAPGSLKAQARRTLARELRHLAEEQRELGRQLRALWLARSEADGYQYTARRLAHSQRSLRRAASRLESNGPRKAPPLAPLTLAQVVQEARDAMGPL